MVPGLEEVNALSADQIHDPMLLGQAAGPRPGEDILQRLGLADAPERVPQDRLDQVQSTQRHSPIRFYPVPKVLDELRMEDGKPLGPSPWRASGFTRQGQAPGEAPLLTWGAPSLASPDSAPGEAAGHPEASGAGARTPRGLAVLRPPPG